MVVPKIVASMGKQRILALVFLAAVAFSIGCSSTDAPERATRIPRSPSPPTVDFGATVDAKVQERLAEATIAASRPTPTTTPTLVATASPDEATSVGGDTCGTATPPPTSNVEPTPTALPEATLAPTATPTIVDDHGDDRGSATAIAIPLEESLVIISGRIEVVDDIDFFAITNDIPGRSWVFTPEYFPFETASGRFPTIDIRGSPVGPNIGTGVITFQPGGGTIFLSVSSERFQKTGDYRVVVSRTVN